MAATLLGSLAWWRFDCSAQLLTPIAVSVQRQLRLDAREQATRLVLGSLVNAFTN
jgi:hypothetical protein